MSATSVNSTSPKAAGRERRGADAKARGHHRRTRVVRHGVAVDRDVDVVGRSSACLPSISASRRSTSTRCTSVPPERTAMPAFFTSSWVRRSAEDRRSAERALLTFLELGRHRELERRRLRRDDVHERTACCPGKTAVLIFLAMSASLVRIRPERGPPIVLCTVVETTCACGIGLGCTPRGHETGEVRHVDPEEGAYLVGDRAERFEVELTRVCRPAGDDDLRLVLDGETAHLVHVDDRGLGVDAVRDDVVETAREVDLHAVRQVAALVEGETEQRVAGARDRVQHRSVGGGAGVRLDVGELGAEQLLGALDRERLGDVDLFAAAVVAASG